MIVVALSIVDSCAGRGWRGRSFDMVRNDEGRRGNRCSLFSHCFNLRADYSQILLLGL
jgi:hypothetical protein